jgi:hypothetical protein
VVQIYTKRGCSNHLLCSELYKKIHYTVQDLKDVTKADVSLSDDAVTLLMGRMRFPTLTIHTIDNGNPIDTGDSTTPPPTVISHKVIGKFSMRYVIFVSVLFAGLNDTCTNRTPLKYRAKYLFRKPR